MVAIKDLGSGVGNHEWIGPIDEEIHGITTAGGHGNQGGNFEDVWVFQYCDD